MTDIWVTAILAFLLAPFVTELRIWRRSDWAVINTYLFLAFFLLLLAWSHVWLIAGAGMLGALTATGVGYWRYRRSAKPMLV